MDKYTINFLVDLKNYSNAKKESALLKYSKNSLKILRCLYKEGFIQSYKILDAKKVYIVLRYFENKPVFNNLKIISKPSHFRFLQFNELLNLSGKKTVFFFSTDKGILTLEECKRIKVGGKILFSC